MAAIANSDFTIFLRQKPEDLKFAEQKNYIDNSGGKIELLKSLTTEQGKYSELAIDSPDGMAVVRFTVDPVTGKIYSTKAEEVEFIRDQESKGVHLLDAIDALLKLEK